MRSAQHTSCTAGMAPEACVGASADHSIRLPQSHYLSELNTTELQTSNDSSQPKSCDLWHLYPAHHQRGQQPSRGTTNKWFLSCWYISALCIPMLEGRTESCFSELFS